MPEHAIVNPIGALASIPARVKGRNKLRGGKGRIIGRIRGEGERDRGAFMERLESKEVRREVGAATDLAEIGPKCSNDLRESEIRESRTWRTGAGEGGCLPENLWTRRQIAERGVEEEIEET